MTGLECSVRNCLFNEEALCCKGDIKVGGGQNAEKPGETSCDSFKERARDVYSNVTLQPGERIDVKCSAVNCVFNENQKCSANHIGIGGNGANRSDETECTSFRLS